MDWANERYVRLYTRNTTAWLMWPWQSRAVLPLLMRALDRSGLLDLGGCGLAGVSVQIGLPAEVCVPGVEGLLKDGCLELSEDGNVLIMPNFIEAQETRQTDAKRQLDSRERRRAEKMKPAQADGASPAVTSGHLSSHHASPRVTSRHHASPDVTLALPSLALPSLALPSLALPSQMKDALSAVADRALVLEQPSAQEKPTTPAAAKVFAHWKQVMGKTDRVAFDAKRRTAVNARLQDGYTADDLCRAVDGCAKTPHNMGQNDRGERYDDLELICRDAAHVDRFKANAASPPTPAALSPQRVMGAKTIDPNAQDFSGMEVGRVKI